jgi:pyridoxal phosphate enzyme (YggS family)
MIESLISQIRDRFERVKNLVDAASVRSGRVPGSVRIVTVTKSQPMDVIRAAIEAGIKLLGENYTEEAVEKIKLIDRADVEWHMIGHIQSRKAALVARNFAMIHSIDSVRIAERLDRFCADDGKTLSALVEVNVSEETSKFGLPAWNEQHWSDLVRVFDQILAFPHLHILGLMTMPPLMEDSNATRPYFQRMRRLQTYLNEHFPIQNLGELSMGTSVDFVAAVEEGATLVRVGESILGPRLLEKHHAF